jgi:hypothetical protein
MVENRPLYTERGRGAPVMQCREVGGTECDLINLVERVRKRDIKTSLNPVEDDPASGGE